MKIAVSTIRSQEHNCSYLSDEKATTTYVHPNLVLNSRIYSSLLQKGFRRSGTHLYSPSCERCDQCISVRIAASQFSPNRAQRRALSANQDISVSILSPTFDDEHLLLYQSYLSNRHPSAIEEFHTANSYREFLTANWCDTVSLEFRLRSELVGVTIIDTLANELSAVYTFYSPTYKRRSLGRFAILKTIQFAQENGIEWVYLGYWIRKSKKMRYKSEYRPQEYFVRGQWVESPFSFQKHD